MSIDESVPSTAVPPADAPRVSPKRRTTEHYQRIALAAVQGRAQAAARDPEWHARRMAKAWATRRSGKKEN